MPECSVTPQHSIYFRWHPHCADGTHRGGQPHGPLGGISRKRSDRNARQCTRSFAVFEIVYFLTLPNTTLAKQNGEPFRMKGTDKHGGNRVEHSMKLAEKIRQTGCRSPQDLLPRIEQAGQPAATTREPYTRRVSVRPVGRAHQPLDKVSAALEKYNAIWLFVASDQIARTPLAKAAFLLSERVRSRVLVWEVFQEFLSTFLRDEHSGCRRSVTKSIRAAFPHTYFWGGFRTFVRKRGGTRYAS